MCIANFDVQEEFLINLEKYHNINTRKELYSNNMIKLQKMGPPSTFLNINFPNQKKTGYIELPYYWVRIPILNPYQNSTFPLMFYFYFKSKKPQIFWDKRGTNVVFENDPK